MKKIKIASKKGCNAVITIILVLFELQSICITHVVKKGERYV